MNGWFEVFRAGKYPQGDVTPEQVEEIARSYDPAWREAPAVLGHPKDDHPAMGWVEAVKAAGGTLLVKFQKLVPEFVEAVRKGLFSKVSVRLLKTERGWYLGHVGFLGAALPAVAGLAPIHFEEGGGETVDAEMEFTAAAGGEEGIVMTDAERKAAELEERLKAAEAKLEQQQVEFTAQLVTERRARAFASVKADLAARVKDGKLAPSLLPGLAEFVVALPDGDSQAIEFTADGKPEKKTPRALFLSFLDRLPTVVQFGQVAGRESDPGAQPRSAEFAELDVAGQTVDEESAALHRKALAYQEKHAGVRYGAAVKAVLAGKS